MKRHGGVINLIFLLGLLTYGVADLPLIISLVSVDSYLRLMEIVILLTCLR